MWYVESTLFHLRFSPGKLRCLQSGNDRRCLHGCFRRTDEERRESLLLGVRSARRLQVSIVSFQHPNEIADMSLALLCGKQHVRVPGTFAELQLRIGIHTGRDLYSRLVREYDWCKRGAECVEMFSFIRTGIPADLALWRQVMDVLKGNRLIELLCWSLQLSFSSSVCSIVESFPSLCHL